MISNGEPSYGLSLHDPETDRLARELSRREGVGLTEAVKLALKDRLARAPQPLDVHQWLEDFYRDFPPPKDRTPVTKEEFDALNDE